MDYGYKRLNYHVVVDEVKIYIGGYWETLKKTGCTLIINRLINQKITLINFLPYCLKKSCF